MKLFSKEQKDNGKFVVIGYLSDIFFLFLFLRIKNEINFANIYGDFLPKYETYSIFVTRVFLLFRVITIIFVSSKTE